MRKLFLPCLVLFGFYATAQEPKVHVANTNKTLLNPEFISPLVPITVRGTIKAPLPAEAKDYLLWYRGKKVNDSILITPEAKLVLYSRKRDMVVVEVPEKKDSSVRMIKEMAKTQKRKEEIYNKIAERKSSVLMYNILSRTYNDFDAIQSQFSSMLKNTIELPPAVNSTASLSLQRSSGYASTQVQYVLAVPEYVRKAYNDVLYKKKNYPSIEFPAPPSRDFGSCSNCDTEFSAKQEQEANKWMEELVKYEAGLVQSSLSIFKSMETLNINTDPEALQIRTELEKVIEFANARLRNKVDLLIRNYGNDFTRLPSVIRAVISIERQKQLLGVGNEDTYGKTMSRLIPLFENFDKYLQKQIDEKNYDVVFNLAFILGMERQRQLLGAVGKENKTADYLAMFNAFNRFRIEMVIDYKSSEEDSDCGTSTDRVVAQNDGDQYISLFATHCKYGFYKNEQHLADGKIHQFGMGEFVALKSGPGVRVHKVLDEGDKCITHTYNYSNLPVRPSVPGVRMSFCDDVRDTVYITELHQEIKKEDKKNSMLFSYINNIYHSTSEQPENEALLDELEEIQDEMEIYTLKESAGSKKLTLEQTKRLHELIARREAIVVQLKQEDEEDQKFMKTFDAKNKEATIMDIEMPLKYENEDFGGKKATILVKVKVVHDPLPIKL